VHSIRCMLRALTVAETLPTFFPLGVAEPDRGTGFVASPRGGVLAIELQNGRINWHAYEGTTHRPLIATGPSLATLEIDPQRANLLRILVLDAGRSGAVRLASDPVELPDWIRVSTVRVNVRLRDQEMLILRWSAQSNYAGGAPPPDHVLRETRRDAAGTLRIDLTTGATVHNEGTTNDADVASSPDLSVEMVSGVQHVYLLTSNGKRLKLLEGKALVMHVSYDWRHVFAHEDRPEPTPWWIFSAETGDRIARVTHEAGARGPCIVVGRVYYLLDGPMLPGAQALSLAARELTTDRLLWEISLPGRPIAKAPPPRP
jgi:hypothetical protein